MWKQERLTKCLKCRPTAWTGRSSGRGSNLTRESRGRNLDIASIYQHEDRGMCWLSPLLLDLIIRLKINTWVCVGGGWMWPSMRSAVGKIAVIQERGMLEHHANTNITSHVKYRSIQKPSLAQTCVQVSLPLKTQGKDLRNHVFGEWRCFLLP